MSVQFVFQHGAASSAGARIKSSDGVVFDLDTPGGKALLRDSETVARLLPYYPDGVFPASEVDGKTLNNVLRLCDGSLLAEQLSASDLADVICAVSYFSVSKLLTSALKTMPLDSVRAALNSEVSGVDVTTPWLGLCGEGIDEWFGLLTAQRFWELAALSPETQAFFDDYCADKVTWARLCPRAAPEEDAWERFYIGLDLHGAAPGAVRVLNLRGCIFPSRDFTSITKRSQNALAILRTLRFPRLERLLLGGVQGDHFLLRYNEAPPYPSYDEPRFSSYVFDDNVLFQPQIPPDQDHVDWMQQLNLRDPNDAGAWDDDEDLRLSFVELTALRQRDVSPYLTVGSRLVDELYSPPLMCAVEFANAWTTHNTIGFGVGPRRRAEDRLAPLRIAHNTKELGVAYSRFLRDTREPTDFPETLNLLPPLPELRWLFIDSPFQGEDAWMQTKKIRFMEWLIAFVQAHPKLEHVHILDENAFAGQTYLFLFVILQDTDVGGVQNLPGIANVHIDNTRRAAELWRDMLALLRSRLTLHYFLRREEPVTYCSEEWIEGSVFPETRQR
jgi:hypothetical protein